MSIQARVEYPGSLEVPLTSFFASLRLVSCWGECELLGTNWVLETTVRFSHALPLTPAVTGAVTFAKQDWGRCYNCRPKID